MKITYMAHDYVELIINGKIYSINLKHNKHTEPLTWSNEINNIQKMSLTEIRKKYKITSVTKPKDNRSELIKRFI